MISYPPFLLSSYYCAVGSTNLSVTYDLPALIFSLEETQQAHVGYVALNADTYR